MLVDHSAGEVKNRNSSRKRKVTKSLGNSAGLYMDLKNIVTNENN